MKFADVTDADGKVTDVTLLQAAEAVHRQLRTELPSDYVVKMERVFAGGARMSVALLNDRVAGVAVYRVYENTADGRKFYVDDLVTDAELRSTGIGKALFAYLQDKARQLGCRVFALDSGTQRHDAHRFYFREGMRIASFAFKKQL